MRAHGRKWSKLCKVVVFCSVTPIKLRRKYMWNHDKQRKPFATELKIFWKKEKETIPVLKELPP
jgi:hypothetical protein